MIEVVEEDHGGHIHYLLGTEELGHFDKTEGLLELYLNIDDVNRALMIVKRAANIIRNTT